MSRTVLIVDDHAAFGSARVRCSRTTASRSWARQATARRRSRRHSVCGPQIVLLDVRLPGIDGFEVAERLAAGPDPPAVVLISSRGAGTYRQRLRGSPARGFIAKAELSGEACLGVAELGAWSGRVCRLPAGRPAIWSPGSRCWAAGRWRGCGARAAAAPG